MARQIVLHIGLPKCGSTYLQRVMEQNRNRLRDFGISYPEDTRGPHPGNADQLGQITEERIETHLAGGMHTLLLSHENLLRRTKRGINLPARAQRLGLQVRVLVFMRPFSQYIFGVYSQRLKGRFDKYLALRCAYDGQDFEGFAQTLYTGFDMVEKLRCWQGYFPQTPLVVRSHLHIQATLQELLPETLHLNWEIPRAQSNPSLRMQDCDAIAAAIRDTTIPQDTVRAMMAKARDTAGQAEDAGKTKSRISWLEALHEARNARIQQLFGHDNRWNAG